MKESGFRAKSVEDEVKRQLSSAGHYMTAWHAQTAGENGRGYTQGGWQSHPIFPLKTSFIDAFGLAISPQLAISLIVRMSRSNGSLDDPLGEPGPSVNLTRGMRGILSAAEATMKWTTLILAGLLAGCQAQTASSPGPDAGTSNPDTLGLDYANWPRVTEKPYPIAPVLFLMCAPLTAEQIQRREAEQKVRGPHAARHARRGPCQPGRR